MQTDIGRFSILKYELSSIKEVIFLSICRRKYFSPFIALFFQKFAAVEAFLMLKLGLGADKKIKIS